MINPILGSQMRLTNLTDRQSELIAFLMIDSRNRYLGKMTNRRNKDTYSYLLTAGDTIVREVKARSITSLFRRGIIRMKSVGKFKGNSNLSITKFYLARG